jgi:hypothetical protein
LYNENTPKNIPKIISTPKNEYMSIYMFIKCSIIGKSTSKINDTTSEIIPKLMDKFAVTLMDLLSSFIEHHLSYHK